MRSLQQKIDYFTSYQKKYEQDKIREKKRLLKLQREQEYQAIWDKKSFFYKLMHRNLNPKNSNLSDLDYEELSKQSSKHKNKKL